jgi:hypothetical protein
MDPDMEQRAADIEETRGDNNNPPEATTGASSMADATGIGSGLPGDKITALELKRLVYKINELSYGVNPDLSADHFLISRTDERIEDMHVNNMRYTRGQVLKHDVIRKLRECSKQQVYPDDLEKLNLLQTCVYSGRRREA